MEKFSLVDITPLNISEETLFCSKDTRSEGFRCKSAWFSAHLETGLRIKIIKDPNGKSAGFIEYMPVESAWRPVTGEGYFFIQCIFVYPDKYKKQGVGSMLVTACEKDAKDRGLNGICTMTSKGPWVTDKRLFIENGFTETERRGRFELMVKNFNTEAPVPTLLDWEKTAAGIKGWHLFFAHQCPWHAKSINAIKRAAADFNINLTITEIKSAAEAKSAPSGFGTFALIHAGKLLEDHYLSETRIRSIFRSYN